MERRPERRTKEDVPSIESVGVIDENGKLIGEADIYRNPKDLDPISWARRIEKHVFQETASCIAISLEDEKIERFNKSEIEELRNKYEFTGSGEIMDLAYKASAATIVMLTRERVSSSS